MGVIFVVLAAGSALVLGPGLVAAVVAHRKGYRPWFWILSCGLAGLLVTALMPGLGKADTPEQRERWENRADWTGGILSTFTFMSMMLLPLIGSLVLFGSVASVKSGFTVPLNAPMSATIEGESVEVGEMETVPDVERPSIDGKTE